MARQKQDHGPKPRAEYAAWLGEEVERAGITPEDAGYKTRVTQWRAFKGDKLTVDAAFAYMRALRRRKVFMPPPVVAIIDKPDYEWIMLGRALREVNPDQWQKLLEIVRMVAGAAKTGLEEIQAAEDLVEAARKR